MKAAPLLVTLLAGTAAHASPPARGGASVELARQVHRLDRALDEQQAATRKLHQKVHALEQAQRQDAARIQRRDRAIEALRRQLQAVKQAAAAPTASDREH